MEASNVEITWTNFKNKFLDKYFLDDVCSRMEVGLLELKQGDMNVADYTTKFEELSRFCPCYNGMEAEGSKCVNFESFLHIEIKSFISYQDIYHFLVQVNQCRIYDEDSASRSAHYKSVSEKNNGNQNRGKPYLTLNDGENRRISRRPQVGKK
ncbi:uncharacterized protein LOC131619950 [Vicia villosa]|uniref:uncharacterized protein LOC131619950 n=1 Tax=Vicia villosa TaxID=3911 RepID=UPI00273B2F49|nr:uncharacterized protein LOC131619950 [Vicia villosa]